MLKKNYETHGSILSEVLCRRGVQATEGEWAVGVNLASVILFTWSLFCETNFKSEIGFKTVANTVGKKTKEALLAFLNNKTKNVSRVTHQKYIIMVVTLFR